MRYCIISDIHSNLEAFQAVLDVVSKKSIDAYLCIGDIVGYGADPNACIRLVESLNPVALVAGNHEWGVLGLLDLGYFNELAKESILWTKKVLSQNEFDFLKSFYLIYKKDELTLVHGTLDYPREFHYMIDISCAYTTARLMKTSLIYVGHTHVPGIFYTIEGKMTYTTEQKVKIDYGNKYIVNVGSIGQPRDGDSRASCGIYDSEEGTVEITRVEYDIERQKDKILSSGLPQRLGYRLLEGR